MTTRGAVGVDLGGTNLRAAYVEVEGDSARIVEQHRQPVGEAREPQAVVEALAELVERVAPPPRLPVGVGVAGMLRGTDGIVANAPNLRWRDVPLGAMVASALGRPVWIDNDLNAICWGEHRFGGARGFRDVICVFVGTGVGGGGVLDGRPYRGAGNVALEIGHVKVASPEQGRRCGCGQRGCLEAYAGGRNLALQAQELATPKLMAQVDGDLKALHGGHLDEAARTGCEQSLEAIERAGRHLGGVLATAVTMFNPSCLLIGGTVWDGCPRLRELAKEELHAETTAPALPWLQLREATLEDDAGVLGAADLALQQENEK